MTGEIYLCATLVGGVSEVCKDIAIARAIASSSDCIARN